MVIHLGTTPSAVTPRMWSILSTKYKYIQSTTVYVLSSEFGLSHHLSRKRVCPSPRYQRGGGHTRLRARGWGSPHSDDWRKSVAIRLLCDSVPSPPFNSPPLPLTVHPPPIILFLCGNDIFPYFFYIFLLPPFFFLSFSTPPPPFLLPLLTSSLFSCSVSPFCISLHFPHLSSNFFPCHYYLSFSFSLFSLLSLPTSVHHFSSFFHSFSFCPFLSFPFHPCLLSIMHSFSFLRFPVTLFLPFIIS